MSTSLQSFSLPTTATTATVTDMGSGRKKMKMTKDASEAIESHVAPLAGSITFFDSLPAPLQKTGHASNQPYIKCNEENQSAMLDLVSIDSRIAPGRKVHLGFSVWLNFDLMSVTKPACGIICDVDDHVIDIYAGMQKCILESPDALTFVDKFRSFLVENSKTFFGDLPLEEFKKLFDIDAELVRPGGWLQSPEKFQAIKALHENGRILYLNLDITDKNGIFGHIETWMRSNNLELDTLYASNIIEWLGSSITRAAYVENLQKICSVNTRFIQAYKPNLQGSPILELGIGPLAVRVPEQKSLKNTRSAPVGRNIRAEGPIHILFQ